MPDHPDQEQLAAYQAGDVDRRERLDVEAHLAGCPSCAELVASVGRARGHLALLEEPDLPPGLHDRLADAVEAQATAAEAGSGPQRSGTWRRAGRDDLEPRVLRPVPWYRRPVAWGAAAALILAALVVPFLTQSGVRTTAGGDTGAGGGAAQEAANQGQVAPANVPVLTVQGEVTAGTVRERLAAHSRAQAARGSTDAPERADQDQGTFRSSAPAPPAQAPPAAAQPPQTSAQAPPAAAQPPQTSAQAPQASAEAMQRQACLPAALAAADPATRPLVPVFFIEGTYKGRQATILVTTSTPQPNRVDLWVFPRDNCTSPILATERVR